MASKLGPGIVKNGLVFGYDTGYGVADNNTSTKFYPGEPTVNSLNSINLFGYSGITLGSDVGGTYLETNSGTTGYNYIKVPNIAVYSNETYTWSFELKSLETILQGGNKYYFDANEYSNEFSNSNDQSRASSSQILPPSLPSSEWVKFALTITMKPNLTGAYSYDFLNFIKPHFTSKKIYYRNMQFEHNKSRHTPYVAGTRSSTQSLIDLKRTTDIDVSNISFDSIGQPTFDGTNDRIFLANNFDLNDHFVDGGDFSIEAVIYMRYSASQNGGVFTNQKYQSETDPAGFGLSIRSNNSYSLNLTNSTPTSYQGLASIPFNVGNYHHIVYTFNSSTGKVVSYSNGSQYTYITNSSHSWNIPTDSTRTYIGYNAQGGWGNYINMDIPIIRVYNKVITAQEVKQNFNAHKRRFSI